MSHTQFKFSGSRAIITEHVELESADDPSVMENHDNGDVRVTCTVLEVGDGSSNAVGDVLQEETEMDFESDGDYTYVSEADQGDPGDVLEFVFRTYESGSIVVRTNKMRLRVRDDRR